MNEYAEVLSRSRFEKFPLFKSKANIIISKIQDISTFFQPKIKLDVIKDQTDNKFIELAMASKAEFLITGNFLDFTIEHFENTRILSPRNYWDNFKP